MARRPIWISLVALAAMALLLPHASAHATRATDDGKYFITVGNQNEPATTYMVNALDLIIRTNVSGQRGPEIAGVHLTLDATLISPSGAELHDELVTQHGAVGRYAFTEPYVLTEPGQYQLRLAGTINQTVVNGTWLVSEPLEAWGNHTFPAANLPAQEQLQASNEALKARVASLEADVVKLKEDVDKGGKSPGPAAVPTFLALGLIALVLLRRRSA